MCRFKNCSPGVVLNTQTPLDRSGRMPYSRDGLNHSKVEPATTGGSAMIVFLSLPNLTSKYQRVIATLEERGLTVVTNFDWSGPEVLVIQSDRRRELIQQSDAYVYFSTPNHPLVREIEFGYAIGLGLPVAFVGEPKTQMHGYGDVF